MNKALLVFVLLIANCTYSQNVFIKSDNKLVGFDQLKNIKIYQFKQSSGKDSLQIITEVDSLYKTNDTLFVKPWLVEERSLQDTAVEIIVQRIYKTGRNTFLKIPIKEIDMVSGKKRAIAKLFSVTSVVAFLGVVASIPLRLSNSDNQAVGNSLFIASAPVLIACWTLQGTLAKKRYHFDKKSWQKKIWTFN